VVLAVAAAGRAETGAAAAESQQSNAAFRCVFTDAGACAG
jgi:hypothetical protein